MINPQQQQQQQQQQGGMSQLQQRLTGNRPQMGANQRMMMPEQQQNVF